MVLKRQSVGHSDDLFHAERDTYIGIKGYYVFDDVWGVYNEIYYSDTAVISVYYRQIPGKNAELL